MSSDLINIEEELVRLARALSDLTDEFEGLSINAATARTDYDVKWAKTILKETSGKDTVKVRESIATEICEKEMREARIAEAIRDAAKERIRALQSMLTVHQSRLKFLDEGRRIH